MYLRDGLVRPNRLGLRILPYQLLETSWVIVATRGRHIVGTLSVIEDGELGLPVVPLYATEVTRLCRPGRRIVELTCFATTRAAGTQSRTVLRQLLGSAIQLAARRKIDYFIICVHPRHARFYMHRLGFIHLGPLRCCPWVLDQPAVAMFRKLGSRSDAKSLEDLTLRGPSFHATDDEPNPASRACRAYFLALARRGISRPLAGEARRGCLKENIGPLASRHQPVRSKEWNGWNQSRDAQVMHRNIDAVTGTASAGKTSTTYTFPCGLSRSKL